MKRTILQVMMLVLPVLVLSTANLTSGQKEKAPNIREVMGKLNRGPNSLTPTLGKDLGDDEPDWSIIQDETKEYVELTGVLGKNSPPKGDKKSWEKLTAEYVTLARELDAAARKKDKKGAISALAKINRSCTSCHKEHRPK